MSVVAFSSEPLQAPSFNLQAVTSAWPEIAVDWLALGVWSEPTGQIAATGVPAALQTLVRELVEAGDFRGRRNELLPLFHPPGVAAARLLLVGLGKPTEMKPVYLGNAGAAVMRYLRERRCQTLGLVWWIHDESEFPRPAQLEAVVRGLLVGRRGQNIYQSADAVDATEDAPKPDVTLEQVLLVGQPVDDVLSTSVERGQIIGTAIDGARELINRSPSEIYPESFVALAKQWLQDLPVTVEVLEPPALESLGMGCLLAVGAASAHSPRLLTLRYTGHRTDSADTTAHTPAGPLLTFVGKGVTYDSGGLTLKPVESMKDMKCDMSGAAAVLAATWACARLKLPLKLLTVIPLAENMISGTAFRVGDILRARNGLTVEVGNTDAEGRLILADALCHALEHGATHLVDVATLTGSCMIALGSDYAGVMSNHLEFQHRVLQAGERAGELLWPLPMDEEFAKLLESEVADLKNVGPRWGGAITAAKFLERFVDKKPWVHLDIAGPAFAEKATSYRDGGATGFAITTLLEVARDFAH